MKVSGKRLRTIALEVGMQDVGLALALAKGMRKIATVGLAYVIFGTMMNLTASSLAMVAQPATRK